MEGNTKMETDLSSANDLNSDSSSEKSKSTEEQYHRQESNGEERQKIIEWVYVYANHIKSFYSGAIAVILNKKSDDQNENENTHVFKSTIISNTGQIIFFTTTTFIAYAILKEDFSLAAFLSNILRYVVSLLCNIIGTAISIGLGLGLASHVYETLHHNSYEKILARQSKDEETNKEKQRTTSPSKISPSKSSKDSHGVSRQNLSLYSSNVDSNMSYFGLMTKAGYPQGISSTFFLRGQSLPSSSDSSVPEKVDYNTIGTRGKTFMNQMWPNLSKEFNDNVGSLIDLITRDYVISWFGSVDASIHYVDPASKRNIECTTESKNEDKSENENDCATSTNTKKENNIQVNTNLLASTEQYKSTPFIHYIILSLAHTIGQLATVSAENVNIMELVLVKFVKALGKTLEHYREAKMSVIKKRLRTNSLKSIKDDPISTAATTTTQSSVSSRIDMRKSWQNRSRSGSSILHDAIGHASSFVSDNSTGISGNQNGQPKRNSDEIILTHYKVSEVEIVRELLSMKRLHKALTFGVDVPSLLLSTDDSTLEDDQKKNSPSQNLLHHYLFNTKMIEESELDYNRLISNKICRKVLPSAEIQSPMVKAFAVEVIAGCMLTPIMGFFEPDTVNGWIIQAVESYMKEEKIESVNSVNLNVDDTRISSEYNSMNPHAHDVGVEIDVQGKEIYKDNTAESVTGDNNNNSGNEKITLDISEEQIEVRQNSTTQVDADETIKDNENKEFCDSEILDVHEDTYISDDEMEDESEIFDDAGNNNISSVDEKTSIQPTENDADFLLPLLKLSVVQLNGFVNDGKNNTDEEIDWEDPSCRSIVCQLVVVIEAALQHGRRIIDTKSNNENKYERDEESPALLEEEESDEVEKTDNAPSLSDYSLIDLLLEMTMSIDGFKERISEIDSQSLPEIVGRSDKSDTSPTSSYEFFKDDSSTLRPIIVAWLQTGDIYQAFCVFCSSSKLRTYFYNSNAFLRNTEMTDKFMSHLKLLDRVDVLVDTMSVLKAEAILSPNNNRQELKLSTKTKQQQQPQKVKTAPSQPSQKQNQPAHRQMGIGLGLGLMKANIQNNKNRLQRLVGGANPAQNNNNANSSNTDNSINSIISKSFMRQSASLPYHLDFRRNETFAKSLRAQRERRTESWKKTSFSSAMGKNGQVKMIDFVSHSSSRPIHRELHYYSRVCYSSTLSLSIHNNTNGVSKIKTETVSGRRMIEVPDDDSSFLLRAQPRALNGLSIHRDQQNVDNSYKSFVASYDEQITNKIYSRYTGARFIRTCILRYFPSNRTCTVVPYVENRHIFTTPNETNALLLEKNEPRESIPEKFQKDRNLCVKVVQRGPSSMAGSMLTSVMELSDFNYTPRTGKAIEFVYRSSLFERPMIELGGKRFSIHDSNVLGPHRADASALELSDASLTAALILYGSTTHKNDCTDENDAEDKTGGTEVLSTESNHPKESESTCSSSSSSSDSLLIDIKVVNPSGQSNASVKSYRPSFIRSVLLVKSCRQEAQRQCLLWSVRAGSARQATKSRTEGLLQPTLTILDFAASKDAKRESTLLRDLHFGMNHLNKMQLRSKNILNPRYPTVLRNLKAAIEGWCQSTDDSTGGPSIMYKIRCVVLVEDGIFHDDDDQVTVEQSKKRNVYKEEWIIMRSFREFMTLHKHLKTQMSPSAASGNTGSRFSVAATASSVFAPGQHDALKERRGQLLSLSHAAKLGALGATKKSIERRQEILNSYLDHLLSPNSLLRGCSELLQFLVADQPLDFSIPKKDKYGRTSFNRIKMDANLYPEIGTTGHGVKNTGKIKGSDRKEESMDSKDSSEKIKLSTSQAQDSKKKSNEKKGDNRRHQMDARKVARLSAVRRQVNKVKLSEVRGVIFDFIRQLFDLDNATFFRSRMVSILRTMSLMIISAHDFNKLLTETYLSYVNGDYMGSLVKSLCDTIWPGGVFYTPAPSLSPEEKKKLEIQSREKLLSVFPDQLKTVLGQDITEEGLGLLHEMFNNKLVVKSLGYMITDMIFLEMFPELSSDLPTES